MSEAKDVTFTRHKAGVHNLYVSCAITSENMPHETVRQSRLMATTTEMQRQVQSLKKTDGIVSRRHHRQGYDQDLDEIKRLLWHHSLAEWIHS